MAVDFGIIGKRIKQTRKAKGYTQEQLAEKMNVSIAYLSKVETGKIHLNLERLSEICGLLEVTEGEILNGVSNHSAHYLQSEFNDLLNRCSPKDQKLIFHLAETIYQESLR